MRDYPMTRNVVLLSGALVLIGVALFGMWYFSQPSIEAPGISNATTTPPGSEPVPSDTLPAYSGEPVGTLNPNASFLTQVPPDVYAESKAELAALATKLEQQPNSPADWFRVAYIKHFYGDEIGARDAYLYLIAIKPDDTVSIYNLAVLLGYDLKEPKQAIPYFERALTLDPRNESFYMGFADFTRDVEKSPALAENVLLRGLQALPASVSLMSALAGNYALMGRTDLAIQYYEKALASGGLTPALKEAVTAELARLKAKQ